MNIRRMSILVVGAILLLSVPFAVTAQSAADVAALSRYFPAELPLFVGVRADDAYLDSLDTLIQQVTAITGDELPLPDGIRDTLSLVIGELVPGGTFDNTIRAWMGDTVAFGATDLTILTDDDEANNAEAVVLAIAVDDAAALRAFIEEVLIPNSENATTVETLQTEDTTVYEVQNNERGFTYYAVTDNVAFVTTSLNALETIITDGSGLNTVENFNAVLAELPEDQYNIVAYVDMPALLEASLANAQTADPSMRGSVGAAGAIALTQTGEVAIGATLLDARTLSLDVAQLPGDAAAETSASVDPTFVRFIPAGTPLVIQGHDLAGGLNSALTMVRDAAAAADSADINGELIDDALRFANFFTRGTLGLDLQEDILSWLTGDFAVTFALADSFPASMEAMNSASEMPVEFGLLFEATNPDQATALVAGLRRAAETAAEDNDQISVESAVEGGAEALRVTIDSADAPFDIVLMAGATDNVFILGTEHMVAAALNPVAGLDTDPLFQEASAYVLPNAAQVWYFAGDALMPLVDLARSTGEQNSDDLEQLLTLFHSSTISSMVNGNGAMITRAVFTLPE